MRALIVDDERTVRLTIGAALEAMNHGVTTATDRASALNVLKHADVDVVLLDVRLSDENGLDLLGEILSLSPRMPVVIITAYASIDMAVEAMRRGAFDYVPKPCTPEQLRGSIQRVEAARRDQPPAAPAEQRLAADLSELDLTEGSTSPVMQEALDTALKAAASDATVLLLGESGAGKSAMARAIHQRGARAAAPFVTMSCQNLSRDLLEAELFGHTKGAFAGAVADGRGKIAAAEGGALFLDEVGDLPAEVQTKLLRLLQDREYERFGETASHHADVRVMAATSQNMREAISSGKLRNDLYYRLSVIPIALPPLRSRTGDIDHLVEAYLRCFAIQYGRPIKRMNQAARRKLRQYEWPGNLRELRNVIERAVILSGGEEITPADLPDAIRFATDCRSVRRSTLEEIEIEHIRHVLANTASLQEASSVLGIDPTTLYRKRKKLGV